MVEDVAGAVGRSSGMASHVAVRKVAFEAPWDWLSAGWVDLWKHPTVSIGYGAAFSLSAFALLAGLFQFGWQSLILALCGGFLILGPFVAVGLYDTSRRIEAGEPVSLATALTAGFKARGQIAFMGAILFFVFFVWVQIALLLFMLFIGTQGFPPPSAFIPTLLFTPNGLGLLVVGTIVGGLLATFVFAISAVSIPLLLVERMDAITAISASIQAVRTNFKAMALWAALIAGFTAIGLATLFAGLVLVFPLVGHATWHAYRSMLR